MTYNRYSLIKGFYRELFDYPTVHVDSMLDPPELSHKNVKMGDNPKLNPTTGPSLLGVTCRELRVEILAGRFDRKEKLFYPEEIDAKNSKFNPLIH
jgi:hypothetical protein